jgi:pheromone shutdown protein TraB
LLFRRKSFKEVVFLVEGVEMGSKPNARVYDTLVGGLINFDHYVFGWDNFKLSQLGINLIKEGQELCLKGQGLESQYIELKEKRSEILRDITISAETSFEMTDVSEEKMKSLLQEANKIADAIVVKKGRINEIADERNDYLYKSIFKVLEKKPEAIIFVIGGESHFKYLSKIINDISHCILNIKEIRKISDMNEALNEVYGN